MNLRFFPSHLIVVCFLCVACSEGAKESSTLHTLTTSVIPTEAGTISPAEGNYTHNHGEQVQISATANEHWVFDSWGGDLSGTANPIIITMNSDRDVSALFRKRDYPLALTVFGQGIVEERIIQQRVTDYPHGSLVELTAIPLDGWEFREWRMDASGNQNPEVIEVNEETTVHAVFRIENEASMFLNTFNGSGFDLAYDVAESESGNIGVTGIQWSADGDFAGQNLGDADIFVFNFSPDGELLWRKNIGGSSHDEGSSIYPTHDNGYVISGTTRSVDGHFSDRTNSLFDLFAIKLSENGQIEWQFSLEGTGQDNAMSVIQTSSKNYVLTGSFRSNDGDFEGLNQGMADTFVIKLNEFGEMLWLTTIGGSNNAVGSSVIETQNGKFLVSGTTSNTDGDFAGTDVPDSNYFVAKLNSNGELIWIRKIENMSHFNNGGGITMTPNGNFVLAAQTRRSPLNVKLLKISGDGDVLWASSFGGNNPDAANSISVTADGNLLVTGSASSFNGPFSARDRQNSDVDIMAGKLSLTGELKWVKTFGGTSGESGYAILETMDKGIVIVGGYASDDNFFEGQVENTNYAMNLFIMKLNQQGEYLE